MLEVGVLVVLALAVYRGTQLVVHDSILDPLRERVEVWALRSEYPDWAITRERYLIPEDGTVTWWRASYRRNVHAPRMRAYTLDEVRDRLPVADRRLGSWRRQAVVVLLACVYCSGFWVAGLTLAAWLSGSSVLRFGVMWFAVAGAGVLVNRWDDSRKDA